MSAVAELAVRRSPAAVSTWNEADRTVQVVWAAGADVVRHSWAEGRFVERLRMTPEAVDLSRLNNGASLLDSHSAWSMADRLGVVVAGSARIENGQGVATVQLLTTEGGEALADACRSGAGFLLSVGYRTTETEHDEGDGTSLPIITATRWQPMEISAVPIPADPAARTRTLSRSPDMSNVPDDLTDLPTTRAAPPTRRPTASAEDERRRVQSIEFVTRTMNLPRSAHDAAIANGMTVEDFRTAAFDWKIRQEEATSTFSHRPVDGSDVRAASTQAETVTALAEVLGRKSSRSGIEVARDYLERSGMNVRAMADRDVGRVLLGGGGSIWAGGGQRAMHTTSDFAFLVGTAANNVLLDRFAANPSALKGFSRQRNAPDFRDICFFRAGEVPPLKKVNEHGEITSGTLSEESNGFRIETYGRIFPLTFQAGVNDGLGAFSDFLAAFADSATTLEADLFFDLLKAFGPKLDDGLSLFHASHGNLAAEAAALSIDSVSEGVITMRTQRNVNGDGFAGTVPTAILVGPALELRAKQLVAEIQVNNADQVNPHRLEVVVEDRFGRDFHGWYLLADPSRRPAFLHGGLEGQNGPKVDTREGWEVLGTEYRVVHHFGAGVHDHRAIYFNEGVPPTP